MHSDNACIVTCLNCQLHFNLILHEGANNCSNVISKPWISWSPMMELNDILSNYGIQFLQSNIQCKSVDPL